MTTIIIYSLTNPINNNIFYIGKTARSLEMRLGAHINDKIANYNKIAIIKAIVDNGLLPIITEIERHICENEDQELKALLREGFWMNYYASKGIVLCSNYSKPRLLSAYKKESFKSSPVGIRFDTEKLNFIKQREGLKTNQSVVDFLLDNFVGEF